VKKNNQQSNFLRQDTSSTNDEYLDKTKTTNVNILLNRVRLDQKRTLKKRIVFASLIIVAMSLLIAISIL
tara:strand:- start:129 stop:338 length:210 start_codon:yes stop_codon:yes gene_type:complete